MTHASWKGAVSRCSWGGRLALLSLLGVCGVLGLGTAPALALPIDYFALGDSVASGYGLSDDGTPCRRSTDAYPWLVLEHLRTHADVQRFDLVACSGTTTVTVDSQITHVLSLLSNHPTLVSLTVGANDFRWMDLFPFSQQLCTRDRDEFRAWVERLVRTVEDNLVFQLGRLLAHPNVEVILTEYYNPTNASGAFWELVNPRCRFVNVYNRSEELVHALNGAIAQAWLRLGRPSYVHLAALHTAFHGHEAPRPSCGADPPGRDDTWIQYLGDPASNATPAGGDCFHPNRAGAERFAEAVTGLVPPDLALPLRLQVDDSSLAPGETLTLTVTITPESTPMVVDLYVALQLPDQSLWFLHGDGSFTPETQPYLRQWPVASFRGELFHYTFTGSEPPGHYRWLAVFTEAGTGSIVGAIAQAPFTFSP